MSATIADYKESERIPAEFASNIEDMYNDAKQTHKVYPNFDLEHFRLNLIEVLNTFREGTRINRRGARREIAELQSCFARHGTCRRTAKLRHEAQNTANPTHAQSVSRQLHPEDPVYPFGVFPDKDNRYYGRRSAALHKYRSVLGRHIHRGGYHVYYDVHDRPDPSYRHTVSRQSQSKDDVSLFLLREARTFLESEGKEVAPVFSRLFKTRYI